MKSVEMTAKTVMLTVTHFKNCLRYLQCTQQKVNWHADVCMRINI